MTLESLSPRGQALARSIAKTLELLREHRKLYPGEVQSIYRLLIAHIRSDAPQLMTTTEMDQ